MPRGGHDIPVSGTHLKGTQWLRRVDPTVGYLKGTPWSRRVWTPQTGSQRTPGFWGVTRLVAGQMSVVPNQYPVDVLYVLILY